VGLVTVVMFLSSSGKLHCEDRKFQGKKLHNTAIKPRWGNESSSPRGAGLDKRNFPWRQPRSSVNGCRRGLGPVQTRLPVRAKAKQIQLLSSNAIQSLSTQRSKQLDP